MRAKPLRRKVICCLEFEIRSLFELPSLLLYSIAFNRLLLHSITFIPVGNFLESSRSFLKTVQQINPPWQTLQIGRCSLRFRRLSSFSKYAQHITGKQGLTPNHTEFNGSFIFDFEEQPKLAQTTINLIYCRLTTKAQQLPISNRTCRIADNI
ncbi:hypothetical protein C8N47_101198 [Mangrovibacterium marinum]|uniref:Uncharacterized protein n=1 Tax=Mangrovibacterium marinum TaxID=1639118 RepID=A0A2T5C6H2_9BACT|nr:hypothetical protein C8N47_101198 [Mangrovibacterium marinum]